MGLILTTLLLCAAILPTSAETVNVSTAAELKSAINANTSASIHLTADIDMSGWSCIDEFKGTIDGEVLTGETTTSVAKDYNGDEQTLDMHKITGVTGCLFQKLTGATLKYLLIEGAAYEANGTLYSGNGMVVMEATNCTFEHVYFNQCTITDGVWLSSISGGACNVGLLAYKATGCTLTDVGVSNSSVKVEGNTVGGLVAQAYGTTFNGCCIDVLSSVFGDSSTDSRVGGLAGQALKNGSTPCTFNGCVSYALVGTGKKADQLGGLVGYSEGTKFNYCRNYGMVAQVTDDKEWDNWTATLGAALTGTGALMAYSKSFALSIHLAIRAEMDYTLYGTGEALTAALTSEFYSILAPTCVLAALEVAWLIYELQDPDEVGGICGSAVGGSFNACSNSGYVRCLDAYCGGIVGLAENGVTITDCLNTANILADEQTGGIVGTLKGSGSTITGCLNTGAVYATADTRGPIYGELADGATSGANHYSISNTSKTSGGITYVTRDALASGSVALAMNGTTKTVWRQKVGTDLVPMPLARNSETPLVGDEGNEQNNDVDCWVEVSTADELKSALTDSYAWIRLTADIDLGGYANHKEVYGLSSEQYPFRGKIDGQGHSIEGLFRELTWEDTTQHDHGLLNYANGAQFKDLNLCNLLFRDCINVGALVGNSTGCTYDNVTLGQNDDTTKGCNVWAEADYVGGLVGLSQSDTFTHCATLYGSANCGIRGDGLSSTGNAIAGGLAGGAVGSTFQYCTNDIYVRGDDDRVGGIVGEAIRCTFTQCTNTRLIEHCSTGELTSVDDELAGIAAYAEGCTIDQCTNTATCRGGDAYIGGIVGYACGGTTITNCLNTGTIYGDEQTGGIVGFFKNASVRNCLTTSEVLVDDGKVPVTSGWNRLFGENGSGAQWSNNYILHSSYDAGSGGRALVTEEQLASGQVAWWLNQSKANGIWRQTLTGESKDALPTLDQTHDAVDGTSLTGIVVITNEEELKAFATRVNGGETALWGMLAGDITLTGEWTPIGNATALTELSKAYKGTFMGGGHTIDLGTLTATSNRYGLFGTLTTGATISDLIVKGTLNANSNSAVGAIAGAAEAATDAAVCEVKILRCGNKADITNGGNNIGGLVGATYTCENLKLIVTDCFNTGAVSGNESAALCGNIKKLATFTHCWNTGSVTGTRNSAFARPSGEGATLTFVSCYQLSTLETQEGDVIYVTADEMKNSVLCYHLNDNTSGGENLVWQQDLGNDDMPVFGDKGLYHTRTMTNAYGTACLPFDVQSNNDVQFYTLQSATAGESAELVFAPAETVAAGTPCLMRRLGDNTTVEIDAVGNNRATNPLTLAAVNGFTPTGTYESTSLTDVYYIASGTFWYAKQAVTIPAYRAWFAAAEGASALALRIGGTTEVISIEATEEATQQTSDGAIYDLSGRRYTDGDALAPGIYIVNGKKQVIR